MESKKIAEIMVNIVNTTPTPIEQYLEDYNYCPLCGDELLYTHVTHFGHSLVKEEAHCESCKIKVKNNDHKLQ
ncbi:MAG: hypothetical protein KDD38_05570 [Bdellovibrionales bacterium]|nr:hypothetical protein [Bdellovibrionales bacterium]